MRERRVGSRGIAAEQRRRDWYVEWAADDDARLAVMETGQLSVRFGEGVLEVVGVFAVGDGDVEFAGQTEELASAGIGNDGDGELIGAAVHGAGVLEDEGADAAVESAGDTLDGDVAGRALDVGASGQHCSLAGAFEIAVDLFVDGHPAEGGVLEFAIGSLGSEFHFKGSGRVSRHDSSLLD